MFVKEEVWRRLPPTTMPIETIKKQIPANTGEALAETLEKALLMALGVISSAWSAIAFGPEIKRCASPDRLVRISHPFWCASLDLLVRTKTCREAEGLFWHPHHPPPRRCKRQGSARRPASPDGPAPDAPTQRQNAERASCPVLRSLLIARGLSPTTIKKFAGSRPGAFRFREPARDSRQAARQGRAPRDDLLEPIHKSSETRRKPRSLPLISSPALLSPNPLTIPGIG